ncbi:hypothetical protein C1H46_021203 [Malus baccata]|uniref:Uncharacterized protein n=1 Tax=Malus baccata TaxID=106549 RepID=A0A540M379_MALBA|nr:hypothetical protein C1H46_021203 [Malus baccata]
MGTMYEHSSLDHEYLIVRPREPVGTDIHSNSCEQVHVRMNSSDACSERHCTDAVLENMYQSLGDDEGGVQESGDHEDRHRCCFLTQSILNGSQKAASMNAGVVSNGFSNKSNHHTVWRKLQVIGTDLISLARNLSDMSRASYNEQVR